MLDKVAFNRKEYVVNNILEDEENLDEADGFRTKIKEIIDQIIEEFKKSLELDKEKGNFVKGLIKMFTILLNTKYSSITKLQKIIRTSADLAIALWPEQKQLSGERIMTLFLFLLLDIELEIKT